MHCGDQRHEGLCLGRSPWTSCRRVQGRSQGTTLRASDLHNALCTIHSETTINSIPCYNIAFILINALLLIWDDWGWLCIYIYMINCVIMDHIILYILKNKVQMKTKHHSPTLIPIPWYHQVYITFYISTTVNKLLGLNFLGKKICNLEHHHRKQNCSTWQLNPRSAIYIVLRLHTRYPDGPLLMTSSVWRDTQLNRKNPSHNIYFTVALI